MSQCVNPKKFREFTVEPQKSDVAVRLAAENPFKVARLEPVRNRRA